MTTAYRDPRSVSASLQQPEIDRASLNDVLADQGWGVQAVNWVFEAVTGESLVATIITPITGDWSKIRADGDAWRMVGNAMNDLSYNLTDAVGKVRDHWDGDAAKAHERYIALGWKAALFAEMGVTQLIAKGFDTVASGAEALGKQAARLLDYLVNKLLEAAATVWIPVAGWIKAAEMVWNAYQIYRRVMDIIDTVQKLISDVKSLFDAVGRVFSAIGKLKDADSLAEAMNATQEVAEAGRDVRNAVNDIHDDMTSIKDSATEIADRGNDIGSKVREVYTPPGSADDMKPAAVSSVAPGGAPVAAPPVIPGGPDAPATHTATAGGPPVSAPPTLGSGGGPAGVPTGGGSGGGPGGAPTGGPAAPLRPDTTHAAGAAPTAAPPSHHATPVGGAMPMGAPPMAGGGGDSTRSSGSRPGSSPGSAWPSSGAPSGPAKAPASGLPTPPGQGLPTPPSQSNAGPGGSRPGGGLPTAPSGSHAGSAGSHPTPGSAGSHPTPGGSQPGSGGGLPTPPNSGSHQPGTGGSHPTPAGSGGGLPSPPGHPSASSGTATAPSGGLPSPPGHPTPSAGGGLPSPPGHPTPSSGGGLPSPPGHDGPTAGGHPSPTTDHPTPNGSGGTPPSSTTPHDASGPRPHDTTPGGATDTKPHDGTKPHDTTPHDAGTKPHDADGKPHDGDSKPDAKPDADAKPDTDTKPHDDKPEDTKHDTDTSATDDPKPAPDATPAPDHAPDADPKPHTDDASTGHDTAGGSGADGGDHGGPRTHDMAPQFGEDAIRAQGEGYQRQLENLLHTEEERERYVELSKKPATELSQAEAQHVADIRNQIGVGGDQIVTKVLGQGAVDGYLDKGWQGVQGSIARGVDVVDINNPKGLRDGLALDDGLGNAGWSPIKEGQQEAYQMRWKPGDTADDMFVPYGGPQKADYDSPAEKAHYDQSAQQMAEKGGASSPTRMDHPFTGTGSTGGGVPEWQAPRGTSLGQRAEIWTVNADGSPEKLYAVYESGLGWKKA